jgi:hypothetical protein
MLANIKENMTLINIKYIIINIMHDKRKHYVPESLAQLVGTIIFYMQYLAQSLDSPLIQLMGGFSSH